MKKLTFLILFQTINCISQDINYGITLGYNPSLYSKSTKKITTEYYKNPSFQFGAFAFKEWKRNRLILDLMLSKQSYTLKSEKVIRVAYHSFKKYDNISSSSYVISSSLLLSGNPLIAMIPANNFNIERTRFNIQLGPIIALSVANKAEEKNTFEKNKKSPETNNYNKAITTNFGITTGMSYAFFEGRRMVLSIEGSLYKKSETFQAKSSLHVNLNLIFD